MVVQCTNCHACTEISALISCPHLNPESRAGGGAGGGLVLVVALVVALVVVLVVAVV